MHAEWERMLFHIRLEADVANRSNFQWEMSGNSSELPKTSSVATMFFNRKAHMAVVFRH